MKKVLLTGASGFIGTFLIRSLREKGVHVIGMSRVARLSSDPGLTWIEGDISDEASLFRGDLLATLKDVDTVIHAAALYDLEASRENSYKHNVLGTINVVNLMRNLSPDVHLAYLSSVAIAGNSRHTFTESDFDVGQTFGDVYGSTKFAAEHIVRAASDLKKRTVLRLGIVVGSSIDGTMLKLDGIYHVQHAVHDLLPLRHVLNRMKYVPFPFHENSRLYLVPVDYAAESIVRLIEKRPAEPSLKTFHVVGGSRGVSVRQAISEIFDHYGFRLAPVPVPKSLIPARILKLLKIPEDTTYYMTHGWTFESNETQKYLDIQYPRYRTFVTKLLRYADEHLLQGNEKRKKA